MELSEKEHLLFRIEALQSRKTHLEAELAQFKDENEQMGQELKYALRVFCSFAK